MSSDIWLGMSSSCSIGFAGMGMDLGIDLLQAGELKGEKMESDEGDGNFFVEQGVSIGIAQGSLEFPSLEHSWNGMKADGHFFIEWAWNCPGRFGDSFLEVSWNERQRRWEFLNGMGC